MPIFVAAQMHIAVSPHWRKPRFPCVQVNPNVAPNGPAIAASWQLRLLQHARLAITPHAVDRRLMAHLDLLSLGSQAIASTSIQSSDTAAGRAIADKIDLGPDVAATLPLLASFGRGRTWVPTLDTLLRAPGTSVACQAAVCKALAAAIASLPHSTVVGAGPLLRSCVQEVEHAADPALVTALAPLLEAALDAPEVHREAFGGTSAGERGPGRHTQAIHPCTCLGPMMRFLIPRCAGPRATCGVPARRFPVDVDNGHEASCFPCCLMLRTLCQPCLDQAGKGERPVKRSDEG